VIRPPARIFGHPPAKLAEGHEQHAGELALGLQILYKRLHRITQVLQQTLLGCQLVRVGIVAALRHVINPRGHSAPDQPSHEPQRIAQVRRRIGRLARAPAGDGSNSVRANLRLERRSLDEVQRRAVNRARAANRRKRAPRMLSRGFIHLVQLPKGLLQRILLSGPRPARGHKAISLRVIQADSLGAFRPECLGHLPSHAHAHVRVTAPARRVKIASDPSVALRPIGLTGRLPNLRGTEMRPVGIRVTNPLHNGQLAAIVQGLESHQGRVQAQLIRELEHLVAG